MPSRPRAAGEMLGAARLGGRRPPRRAHVPLAARGRQTPEDWEVELDEEDLEDMSVEELQQEAASIGARLDDLEGRLRSPGRAFVASVLDRHDTAGALFAVLAGDAGHLSSDSMLRFARMSGFDGEAAEWDEEFRLLCEQWGRQPDEGIDRDLFLRLVDDESDRGCYCSTEELDTMLGELEGGAGGIDARADEEDMQPKRNRRGGQRDRSRPRAGKKQRRPHSHVGYQKP